MALNIKNRSILTLEELSGEEIVNLVESAIEFKSLKAKRYFPRMLENRNFCLIFLKPSTRTRTSFVVAAIDEGAHLEIFGAEDIRFGAKESVKDIARVLGRMFDGIAFRGFDHAVVQELSDHAGVPVWNGLSDDHHPTQALADLMTLREEFGSLRGRRLAYVGDGRNNMAHSLMIAAGKVGLDLRIVAPPSLQPSPERVARALAAAESGEARITVTEDLRRGVADCEAVYGDVWVSMGEEDQIESRSRELKGYCITAEALAATGRPDSIFLHCLPALHDLETEFARAHPELLDCTDDVFEGPQSRVFPQAENRMHTIKAMMVATV